MTIKLWDWDKKWQCVQVRLFFKFFYMKDFSWKLVTLKEFFSCVIDLCKLLVLDVRRPYTLRHANCYQSKRQQSIFQCFVRPNNQGIYIKFYWCVLWYISARHLNVWNFQLVLMIIFERSFWKDGKNCYLHPNKQVLDVRS